MQQASGQCSRRARARHAFGASAWRWLAVLLLALGATGQAHAACASAESFTVASSGSYAITCNSASSGNWGWNLPPVTAPSHGTLTMDSNWVLTYTNNGDGATSDSFSVASGDTGNPVTTFTVTIAPPTSSITLSPTSLSFQVGQAVNQTVKASGGTGPYTYAVTSGSLPTGVSLATDGKLSGTTTGWGNYAFTITATDGTNATGLQSYSGNIPAPTIVISPSTLPGIQLNQPYSVTLSSSGGVGPYSYALTSGSGPLPPGLNLIGGVISGTPTTTGSYTFNITSTDSSSLMGLPNVHGTATKSYTLAVISIAPATATTGTVGVAYNPSTTFAASGGTTPYAYAVSSGTLPAGLSLNASSGALTGTPTAGGSFNFTVTATDANNAVGSQAVSMTVNPPTIVVSTAALSTSATAGQAYTAAAVTASGGTSPYTYAIGSGALPAGMSLSGGTLSGTPTATGTFNFTVTATDHSTGTGPYKGTSSTFTLTVNPPSISLSPGALTNATVGQAYTPTAITASGGTVPYTYQVSSGALPPGMNLSGGTLSGTPTAGGSFTFTVQATDNTTGGTYTGTQQYTLTVNAPTISLSPGTLPAGTDGTAYSQTIQASGGTTSYTYTVTSGALPTGLSLGSSTGTLSGTPAGSGTFNFTVTATDSSTGTGSPYSGSQAYVLLINAAAPVANPVATAVAYDSTANPITLNITGGTPTSVTIASQASHGTATASGTSITYTPTVGFAGNDTFLYTASNGAGTSAPATVTITVVNPTLTISASGSLSAKVGQPYTQTFTFSGGAAPYSGYSITGMPAGLQITASNSTSITMSGTPTASGAIQFTVTGNDSSTGNGAFTVSQNFTLNVASATLTLSPGSGSLPGATAGTAYTQNFTTAGGITPYSYAITSGALPAGLSLTPNGTLSGTPTTTGSYNFTVTSTDTSTGAGSPAKVSNAYTLSVVAPTIVISPSTLPGAYTNTAYTQTLGASGGAVSYTYAVTSGALPAGLSLSSGGKLSGTPTTVGTATFAVTATDSLGFTGSQNYSLVVALGAPVANADTATTPSQSAVTIPVTANDTGTIDSIAVASAPSNGTAVVSGTSVIYTPTGTFYGTDTFTYTASNTAGTSAPATVTVTVTPLPAPTVSNQSVQVIGGQSLSIDPTVGATGGPYTAVAIATAPTVGTATVSGMKITYKAPAAASGTDSFSYTLSNAYGTSSPATVTVRIIPRPDPTRDPEVMGLLDAQAQATRRFMRGQIDNFQARLENLHDGSGGSGFQNNLSFIFDGGRQGMLHGPSALADMDLSLDGQRPLGSHTLSARGMPGADDAGSARGADAAHGFTLWASGALNFGTQKLGGSHNGIDFNTSGLTLGADTRLSERLAVGGGVGFGHDASDVGKNGSRSTADAYNVAGYASYRPTDDTFIDGVVGYQWLSFGSHRYVTVDGNTVNGSRNGSQVFGSLSAGFDHHNGSMMLSPYGRLDIASASLDAYTESGDPLYALHYDKQTVDTTSGTLGLRLNWTFKRAFGVLQPMLRVEYRHDFQGSSDATMSYADMVGPLYRAAVGDQSRNHTMLGLGLETRSNKGLSLRIEYQNTFESSTTSNQSVLLHLEKRFQ